MVRQRRRGRTGGIKKKHEWPVLLTIGAGIVLFGALAYVDPPLGGAVVGGGGRISEFPVGPGPSSSVQISRGPARRGGCIPGRNCYPLARV